MTDVETIRAAVTRLREVSGAADQHPWTVASKGVVNEDEDEAWGGRDIAHTFSVADAAHIALADPLFTSAVADLLEQSARDLWAHGPLCCADGCMECDDALWMPHARRALVLARRVLGEEAGR